MKRTLAALVLSAALIATSSTAGATGADTGSEGNGIDRSGAQIDRAPRTGRWNGPCQGWEHGENLTTPAIFNADRAESERKMRRLIACVFHRWAPGNVGTALYVADRESGFNPWATNPSSLCRGLFQHIDSAWASRADTYLWPGWFRRHPITWADPRANAIVAARMVAAGGWGPWSL